MGASGGRPRCRARRLGEQAGIVHQAVIVEACLDAVEVVAW